MVLEKIVILKLNEGRLIPTLPKEMQKEKLRPLESQFKQGTRDLIRGFSPEVERIVLPNIIGLQANEPNFAIKARDFWADISIKPTEEGIKLNIATERKVNGKDEEGKDLFIDFPVNPNDYMVWQIAMQSDRVAKTEEELENLGMYDFFLVDLIKEKEKQASEFDIIDKADMSYSKLVNPNNIEENEDKINQVVELLRDKGEAVDVPTLPMLDKKMMLRKIKETNPSLFIKTVEDPNLGTKALILKMQTYGVITKEGNEYFDGDINIGAGKVAIAWFTKAENSAKVLALQSRLKQAIELKRN